MAAAGPAVLLPPRIAGAVRFDAVPVVRDALTLPGGAILAVVHSGDEVVVAPLVPEHDGVRRALPGDGAFAGLLALLGRGGRVGHFGFSPLGTVPPPGVERAIVADQSNESVVVGDDAVVKLFVRSAPGSQPGIDLPTHLAVVGFTELPHPLGSVTWMDPSGETVVVATAAAYLPEARDGWDWYLELARAWIQGQGDESFGAATATGGLVARLHAALADPSPVLPVPVRRADDRLATGWHERATATLEEALALTAGAEGTRLRARATAARRVLARLERATGSTLTRIHGDLHVGQILEWTGGLAVSDFDGNPLATLERRTAFDSPARDVAAFVRSLDHLARIAQRDGAPRERAQMWSDRSRSAFLTAYRDELRSRDAEELYDEELVRPFEVSQACHEFVYAGRYLPRWLVVADLAMSALLPEAAA